jgi:UV DNA damage endonuclease
MKIGYPCINRTIGCKGGRTFRLKNYSESRLIDTIDNNLECLFAMLRFNVAHNILFFRITSDLVPFASHPVCTFNWTDYFSGTFQKIGDFIVAHNVRISMHPDQFVLINAKDTGVLERSIGELTYHAAVLEAMGLDKTAKIQIHVGGVYGDKDASIARFVARYRELDNALSDRLVIENDDVSYTVSDCLRVHSETGVPVLFDYFHHQLNSSGETLSKAFTFTSKTWTADDGIPMVDYSSGRGDGSRKHAESIDREDFIRFLSTSGNIDFDVMLEIKDKEASALKAVAAASGDPRLFTTAGQE